jgi:hypothetical protein
VSQRQPGQRSAEDSARDAWPSQRSQGGTGLSGVHRTVSGAPMALNLQRSALPKKERNPHRTVSGGAPDSVRCANGSESPTVGFAKEGKKSAPDSVRWCTGLSGAPGA